MKWSNIIRGFFMGITEMIPGISSGTLALLLGIYDNLLLSISKLFTKDYKKAFMFLIPLIIGMGVAILTMSSIINYMLNHYPTITHWFFMGLVLGVVPMMFRLGHYKHEFRFVHYSVIIIVMIGLYMLDKFTRSNGAVTHVEISPLMLIFLFVSGFLGASALVLPGLSGSVIMLMTGAYPIIMYSISEFTSLDFKVVPLLTATGFGIIGGVLVVSRLIHYLLKKYTYLMYALIIGLLFGSVFPIYHGVPAGIFEWIMSIVLFIVGLSVSYYMSTKNNTKTI